MSCHYRTSMTMTLILVAMVLQQLGKYALEHAEQNSTTPIAQANPNERLPIQIAAQQVKKSSSSPTITQALAAAIVPNRPAGGPIQPAIDDMTRRETHSRADPRTRPESISFFHPTFDSSCPLAVPPKVSPAETKKTGLAIRKKRPYAAKMRHNRFGRRVKRERWQTNPSSLLRRRILLILRRVRSGRQRRLAHRRGEVEACLADFETGVEVGVAGLQ